jgi:hypothetical protein
VTLTHPDGTKVVMAMARDARVGPATFRSTEDARCTVPGRYWTDVRVTAADVEGRSLDVFRDRWSGFTVAPSGSAAQAAVMSPPPVVATSRSLVWPVAAIAGGLLVIAAAILRRCKTRAAASCLSRQGEHDQP